jgi:hypothetical protein
MKKILLFLNIEQKIEIKKLVLTKTPSNRLKRRDK